LCEVLVVLLWECDATLEGMLPLPPALNLKGMEASLKKIQTQDFRRLKQHYSEIGEN
jgi:hypothetical protein